MPTTSITGGGARIRDSGVGGGVVNSNSPPYASVAPSVAGIAIATNAADDVDAMFAHATALAHATATVRRKKSSPSSGATSTLTSFGTAPVRRAREAPARDDARARDAFERASIPGATCARDVDDADDVDDIEHQSQ